MTVFAKSIKGGVALAFRTRNLFKNLKVLTITKYPSGVDLTIIITWMISFVFEN